MTCATSGESPLSMVQLLNGTGKLPGDTQTGAAEGPVPGIARSLGVEQVSLTAVRVLCVVHRAVPPGWTGLG